jgi:hypothetical protein
MILTKMGKIALISLALILTAAGAGYFYASYSGSLSVAGEVQACIPTPTPTPPPEGNTNYGAIFEWVASNDDGNLDSRSTFNPIDPGDDGGGTQYDYWGVQSSNDPSGLRTTALQSAGSACDREVKDVGKATAVISTDGRLINITLDNAYPYYYPTIFFAIKNTGNVNITVDTITSPGFPADLAITLQSQTLPQTLTPGQSFIDSVGIMVNQSAAQLSSYTFQIGIGLSSDQVVETGGNKGTRSWGFWKTHLTATTNVFNSYLGRDINIGWKDINSLAKLEGIFYADDANNSDNWQRSDLCKARIKAAKQVVAAILNSKTPNGKPLPVTLAVIRSTMNGNNALAINNLGTLLETYNTSAETYSLGIPEGSADPQGSKNIAYKPFADCERASRR